MEEKRMYIASLFQEDDWNKLKQFLGKDSTKVEKKKRREGCIFLIKMWAPERKKKN